MYRQKLKRNKYRRWLPVVREAAWQAWLREPIAFEPFVEEVPSEFVEFVGRWRDNMLLTIGIPKELLGESNEHKVPN